MEQNHKHQELKAPDKASSSLHLPGPGCKINLCFLEALSQGLSQTTSHLGACLPPGSHLVQALLKEPSSQSHSSRTVCIIVLSSYPAS